MTARVRWCFVAVMALWLPHWAHAQVPVAAAVPPSGALPDRVAERERIHRERTTIDRNLQRAQIVCYQRFAVEDCLRSARRKARSEQAVLRHQEALMDEQDRRERSAQRLQSIDERQRLRAGETLPHAVAIRTPRHPASRGALPTARARNPSQEEAHARQEQRRQALQQQAIEGRKNQAAKLQAAQERKARVHQRQAQDAARGRTPAAPLPP